MTPALQRRSFLAAGLAGAGALVFPQGAFAQQADPEATSESLNASVDVWGRPTAPVMLDGKGPFRFRVDTGANASVISAEAAAALGLAVEGERWVHGTTGTALLSFTRVGRLSAGPVSRRDLSVAIAPPAGLSRCDGILGADVFAGQHLEFDMRARQVSLINPLRVDREVRPPRNMFLRNGMIAEVRGTIGRVPVRLLLDTGADICIINPALDRRLRNAFVNLKRYGRGAITGVTGKQIVGDFVELPVVRFASLTVSDAVAVSAKAPIFDVWKLQEEPAMIVGVDVFSRLSRCVFDYRRGRFEAYVAAPAGVTLA